ncbi:MAG: ATP-binding cassette domain-containing protein [Candidatus Latescibacteria bacterium]|nr:ATP-binding cassette domain-containing protein [Candidatus Latescibacterota bacterium]
MSLIVADALGKYYGAHQVFKQVSFSIEHGDAIGLVGPNGEGKTTLLRILAGEEEANDGLLQGKHGLRVGYLPQDPPAVADTSLWASMLEVFAALRALEAELAALARQLEGQGGEDILQRYSAMQADFERAEGYTYEQRIRTVLAGLGFGPEQYQQPLGQLSGGQRTRALLARLLLDEPDLLLLDEPTNHLDLEAVEWLEHWTRAYEGALVVVSHDRFFLDQATSRTWEMAFGGLETFRGGYSAYVRQRRERYEQRLKQWHAQQEYIDKTEDFIRRFIAGQRTKEAQGRRTRLERFMRREAIQRPQLPQRIRVRLNPPKRTGDMVLELRDLAVGYQADKPILQVPDLEVRRGQRIAVVGPNGQGKTTLVRSILGELALLGGGIRYGANVEVGYLSQEHDYLDPNVDVLDAVRAVKPELRPDQLRPLLASFLFKGDDVFKAVGDLSGGQRSRVALARLALQEANVLILDEPTNHLDIASQEVLEEVLRRFDGTFILVSHDRYLIQALASHVWVAAEGQIHCREGGWDAYLQWREEQTNRPQELGVGQEDRQRQRLAQKESRRLRKQLEQARQRQEQVEGEIQQYEIQLADLSTRIGSAGEAQDMDQVRQLGDQYRALETEMGALWKEWEELAEQLEG